MTSVCRTLPYVLHTERHREPFAGRSTTFGQTPTANVAPLVRFGTCLTEKVGVDHIRIGHDELVIRQRYEAASIVNGILIALWFIVGSIMFFSEEWTMVGTWCFLAGSIELLIRPLIRPSRQTHLRRIGQPTRARPRTISESAPTF